MKLLRVLLLASSIAALIVACADAADQEDVQRDALCPDELAMCGEFCVELDTSFDHCGACGNTCAEGASCVDGACACPLGYQPFEGRCVSDATAEWICSAEENGCEQGEVCAWGMCAPNEMVAGVVKYTNEARAAGQDCGVNGTFPPADPVRPNRHLHQAALAHSEDMASQSEGGVDPSTALDHTGSDGSDFVLRIDRTEYSGRPGGENIAYGYSTPEQVVQGWVDSDGHCANLMAQDFNEIGVGYVERGPGSPWWTQVFGVR